MQKMNKPDVYHVYCDGGSRNNPGPAAAGAVILDKDRKSVAEISEYIGTATNNAAEYIAVILALQEASFLRAEEIYLYLDSQLVSRQLKGEYKLRDANLKKFHTIAKNLFKHFSKIHFVEIPREENKPADTLVNRALDINSLV